MFRASRCAVHLAVLPADDNPNANALGHATRAQQPTLSHPSIGLSASGLCTQFEYPLNRELN